MSLSSGSYGSDGVAERRAQRVLNEKVGDRLPERRGLVAEAEVAPADVREPQEGPGGEMSGSVEASRRHGRFDLRWPRRRVRRAADRPAALTSLEDVPDGLDWDAFSTRCFPGRGRHDLEAISAYDAYTHGRRPRSRRPLSRRRSIALNETIRPRGPRSSLAEPQRAWRS
jgi:hypothetical protein